MVTSDAVLNRRERDPLTMDPNRILQCDAWHTSTQDMSPMRETRGCASPLVSTTSSCSSPHVEVPLVQHPHTSARCSSHQVHLLYARRHKRMTGPYHKLIASAQNAVHLWPTLLSSQHNLRNQGSVRIATSTYGANSPHLWTSVQMGTNTGQQSLANIVQLSANHPDTHASRG